MPEAFARLEPKINAVLKKDLSLWVKSNADMDTAPQRGSAGLKVLGVMSLMGVCLFGALMFLAPFRRGLRYRILEARQMARSRMGRLEAFEGLLLASPWLLGLALFTAFPIVFSIVLSFSRWDPYMPIDAMRYVGLENYRRALSTDKVTGDPMVFKSLWNTLVYAIYTVPLGLSASLGLAMALNQKIRGITFFRTTFYLPSILAGVATAIPVGLHIRSDLGTTQYRNSGASTI